MNFEQKIKTLETEAGHINIKDSALSVKRLESLREAIGNQYKKEAITAPEELTVIKESIPGAPGASYLAALRTEYGQWIVVSIAFEGSPQAAKFKQEDVKTILNKKASPESKKNASEHLEQAAHKIDVQIYKTFKRMESDMTDEVRLRLWKLPLEGHMSW